MNASSEIQQEASSMKSILNTRTKLRVGFWNVRTMYETGKQAQVLREMKENKLHILGVSECRWTDFGKNTTSTGETIVFSGRKDGRHHEGVAIILSKSAAKSLIEYHPVNERIIRARLNTKPVKTSIIQVYSPTNDAESDVKQDFYEALQAEIEKIPKHDLTIVMGDLNAKVGNNNTGFERVIGKYGCGVMNENGEQFVEFCGNNNLVIGGTLFPHKDIHKLTWVSPGGRDKNQIDHIAINGKWTRSLQDVRVRRGADVGSDHHLVTANIKLKLKKIAPKSNIKKYDTGKLSDNKIKQDFRIELRNKFHVLQNSNIENENQIDEHWNRVRDTFSKTSEKVLGFRRQVHKEWITSETWKLIDKRKDLKKKLCNTHSERIKDKLAEQYSNSNKEIKKATKKG